MKDLQNFMVFYKCFLKTKAMRELSQFYDPNDYLTLKEIKVSLFF